MANRRCTPKEPSDGADSFRATLLSDLTKITGEGLNPASGVAYVRFWNAIS